MRKELMEILDFVEGKTHHWGTGITTHICDDENQTKLHNALLELEKNGKVKRHYEKETHVVWKPAKE